MINKKLFDYVKRSLERGQSQKKITTSLIHKGWSRNLVQITIKQVLDGVELKYDLREVLKEGTCTTFEKESFSILEDAQKNNSSRSSGLLIIFISILIILLSSWWLSSSVVNVFNQEGFNFGKEIGELFDPTGYDREESLKIKAEKEVAAEIKSSENQIVENIEKEDSLKDLIDEVNKLQEGLGLEEEILENAEIDAYLKDEFTGVLYPWHTSPGGVGAVKVLVSGVDHAKARIVIDEYESNMPGTPNLLCPRGCEF
jgi:hypothetical protein